MLCWAEGKEGSVGCSHQLCDRASRQESNFLEEMVESIGSQDVVVWRLLLYGTFTYVKYTKSIGKHTVCISFRL